MLCSPKALEHLLTAAIHFAAEMYIWPEALIASAIVSTAESRVLRNAIFVYCG